MKPLFVLMILAALSISALGQTQNQVPAGEKCSLTLAQSPTIRGLKLGMDVEEVLRKFPGSSEDNNILNALSKTDQNFGLVRFFVPSHLYRSAANSAGVNNFELEFLDKRLTSFAVYYNGPEWSSVDQFISKLSESFNLPGANYWTQSEIETLKTLKCVGFEVRASITGSVVQVRNPVANQIVRARREEAKERARKEFKP